MSPVTHSNRWLWPAVLAFCPSAPCLPACAADEPPRYQLAAPGGTLTFVVYGDTRFTERESVANALARRALVTRIAAEDPAAIFVGGDLVYNGRASEDYATYRSETAEWARRDIPVFPALGNHELQDCRASGDVNPCLENWWSTFAALKLRPWRWYSVAVGDSLLTLVLDSDSPLRPGSGQRAWLERQISNADSDTRVRFILILLHYPPVRDPIFPRGRDEEEVQRYLSATAPGLRARVIVVGSHVHNYERFERDDVAYLVSGGGGAKPLPVLRMAGELSRLETPVNFHYLRFILQGDRLTGTMVRFEASAAAGDPWSEPDRFEITSPRAPPTSQQVLAQIRRTTPNLERGAQLYAGCAACHGADGGGTRDGLVPRLAGQHASVLQKQLVDYRYDRRWDPRMRNVVDQHSLSPEAISDVSAYISRLDRDVGIGIGDGSLLRRGTEAYRRSCRGCHGPAAQGDAARAVPRLAGQHYEYLRRQIYDAVDGRRPNFPPSHIRLLARLERDDIAGIADYLARLGGAPTSPSR